MGSESVLDTLISHWPSASFDRKTATEYSAPCPFCPPDGEVDVKINSEGHTFVGVDRFIYNDTTARFFCRQCQRDGRGRGNNGVYSIDDVAELFNFVLPDSFLFIKDPGQTETKALQLLTRADVSLFHVRVDRAFWKNYGWSDYIINKFRLGTTTGDFWISGAHIIPMDVRTSATGSLVFNYFELRRILSSGEKDVRHGSGSNHDYFWFVNDDKESKTVIVTEGAKDAISAYMLGFRNFLAHFGATKTSFDKIEFLQRQGFTTIMVAGDHDPAGESFNSHIMEWAKSLGMSVYFIQYPDDYREGYDISDILKNNGDDAFSVLTSLLVEYDGEGTSKTQQVFQTERATYIEDMRLIDPDFEPDVGNISSLDEIRGDGVGSLRFFIKSYLENFENGEKLTACLAAPPGAGKTKMLSTVVEELAQESNLERVAYYSQLQNELESLKERYSDVEPDSEESALLDQQCKKLEEKLNSMSFNTILWSEAYRDGFEDLVRIGIDPQFWFDFKARNEDNCENYPLTLRLGEGNHDIGYFCEVACPFKEACKRSGYLSQHREKLNYPITIVRHQHLINDSMLRDYTKLIVVDESLLGIINTPQTFCTGDLQPFLDTWWMTLQDQHLIDMMTGFVTALTNIMSLNSQHNPKANEYQKQSGVISGGDFFGLLEKHFLEAVEDRYTLQNLMESVTVELFATYYQPTYIDSDGVTNVSIRSLPIIYAAILDELPEYLLDNNTRIASKLHLVGDRLEIFPKGFINVPKRTPTIVADATLEIPELYEPVFDRGVRVYKPEIRNPLASTYYVVSSDWTRTTHRVNLGDKIIAHKKSKEQNGIVSNLLGEAYDLSSIKYSFDDACDSNQMYREYEAIITYLAKKHNSLLVVVHLYIQDFLQSLFDDKYPKLAKKIRWGHFNALRGTNEFQHFDAVAMFGVHRIPYGSVWREIQAWANRLGLREEIPYEFTFKPKNFHTRTDGYTYRTMTHPFASDYLDMLEVGEMRQSAERIRPHSSSSEKTIYVFSSRPGILYVDDVIKKNRFFSVANSNSIVNEIVRAMLDTYKSCGKILTKRYIMSTWGCGYPTYAAARKVFLERLTNIKNMEQRR